jgi:transposase
VFEARFSRTDCTPFPSRAQCTKAAKEPRIIALQAREYHEALQEARCQKTTEVFRSRYAARAGIEGTHEKANRRCGLRRCRYIRESKAHLQHLLTAAAIDVVRLDDWWAGRPVARTRCSRFAALQPAA